MTLSEILESQRRFFSTGATLDLSFRRQQLQRLQAALHKDSDLLYEAIFKDFRKSRTETDMTELSLVHHEIKDSLKNLNKWSRRQFVASGLANFPSTCWIQPEPFGTALVISPWNYPYQLALIPLVSAIAAGNTCILKPSELTPHASAALAKILGGTFESSFVFTALGGPEVSQELLKLKFDKIFFTGSTPVGRIVAKAAAEHLTPVTLELGGKSPCFVFADADLDITARRIAWGKFLNAGQTCIAPDYLLVEHSIYEPLLEKIRLEAQSIVGPSPKTSESFTRIVNQKHTLRLKALMSSGSLYSGGTVEENSNFIEPTILRDVKFTDPIMEDEIFGPILPTIPFKKIEDVLEEVRQRPRPLALYCFSKNKTLQNFLMTRLSFGGGAINDVVMHITNPRLPFGGIGPSGMGHYHGYAGFQCFSHAKSLMRKGFLFEPPIKYGPYSRFKLWILKLLLG